MEQPNMLPILYRQLLNTIPADTIGDLRSQGTSRHGIDKINQHILSPASEELTSWAADALVLFISMSSSSLAVIFQFNFWMRKDCNHPCHFRNDTKCKFIYNLPHDGLTHWGPRQNGCHFAEDIFKHIFLNGNVSITIKISLNFVPWSTIGNSSALVQIMAWCQTGSKPLPEPMLTPIYLAIWRQ